MSAKTLVVNGTTYTAATAQEIETLGNRIFVPSDGLREGDKITFAEDLEPFTATGKIDQSKDPVSWLNFPVIIERKDKTLQGIIGMSTLTGTGYNDPNPEFSTQKNVPFNPFIIDELTGITKNAEKVQKVTEILKGKTFTITRKNFYSPMNWDNVTELDEKTQTYKVVLKENGKPKMKPRTAEIGGVERIPTKAREVSILS